MIWGLLEAQECFQLSLEERCMLKLPICRLEHTASFSFCIISAGGKEIVSLKTVSRQHNHIPMKSTMALLWGRQWEPKMSREEGSGSCRISSHSPRIQRLSLACSCVRELNTVFSDTQTWVNRSYPRVTLMGGRAALWTHVLVCLDVYRVCFTSHFIRNLFHLLKYLGCKCILLNPFNKQGFFQY